MSQPLPVEFGYFVRHAPLAMAMFDREMNYIAASQKYIESWLGKQEYLGHNHYDLFPDVPERWRATHQRCLKGVTESCDEDPYQRRFGRVDYIDWVTTPWYNEQDEIGGLILYAEIVNERVEAKQKRIQLNQELKSANQKLESFIYAISHNLKEPLLSCVSMAELAEEEWAREDQVALKERLDYLLNTTRRMLGTVEEFIHHANAGGDKITLHEVDLNQVLETVLENLQNLIERKQAVVHWVPLPTIQANEFEMVALFQNLLSNGLEYNDSPVPQVEVLAVQTERAWEFQVSDNGPGIALDNQEEVFSLLQRPVDRDASEKPSMGLPLCRRIVRSMQGRMWLESHPDQGTTVHFTLPISKGD